jgi:hypothetical protein
LENLPRLGEHVFPSIKVGKALSNMAMLTLLKKMNVNADGKPRWVDSKSGRAITPHGLRATFRTWGEDAGFSRDLLEESLGPKSETRSNELIGGLTVSNAVTRLWRLGRNSAAVTEWPSKCRRALRTRLRSGHQQFPKPKVASSSLCQDRHSIKSMT